MRRRFFLGTMFTLLNLTPAGAEILDRIVMVVAHHPITELELEEEVRVTAFFNGQTAPSDDGARRAAASRLMDQALIQREMRLTRFPQASAADVDAAWQQLVQQQGGAAALERRLAQYQISGRQLRAHLAVQLTTLRFVAFRFRPQPRAGDTGIARPAGKTQTDQTQTDEAQTDQAMDEWLEQARKQVHVMYLDPSLENPRS